MEQSSLRRRTRGPRPRGGASCASAAFLRSRANKRSSSNSVRCQVHRLAASHAHCSKLKVDHELADLEHRLPRRRRTTREHGAQTGEELIDADGLGDVVVRTCVERSDLLLLLADCGEHDDRRRAPASEARGRRRCRCGPVGRGRGSPLRAVASRPPRVRFPPLPPFRPRSLRREGSSEARGGSAARRPPRARGDLFML